MVESVVITKEFSVTISPRTSSNLYTSKKKNQNKKLIFENPLLFSSQMYHINALTTQFHKILALVGIFYPEKASISQLSIDLGKQPHPKNIHNTLPPIGGKRTMEK